MSKNLVHIKNMLYGTAESEPQADIVVAQLAQELYNNNLLLLLVQNLSRIDFEVNIKFNIDWNNFYYPAIKKKKMNVNALSPYLY